MPLPNFFIIGAQKSGTTALYRCLKQHPDVYMSPKKEPHYFVCGGKAPLVGRPGGDLFSGLFVWRADEYFKLFAEATQTAIGEASTGYIRSAEVAGRIHENLPDSKIVAVLRHPADRAYSSYRFLMQHDMEPARSFQEALAHESVRIQQDWAPGLLHRANGFYYRQLRAYYDLFPHDHIKVFLYEDWNKAPDQLLRDLFEFLNVDPDFTPTIHRDFVTVAPRYRRLHHLATHQDIFDRRMPRAPALLRRACKSIVRRLDKAANRGKPPPIDPAIRRSLTEEYRDDILQLQDLIGRDLSHWLKSNGQ